MTTVLGTTHASVSDELKCVAFFNPVGLHTSTDLWSDAAPPIL